MVNMIFRICINSLRRLIINPRFIISAIILIIWVHFLVSPVLSFSQYADVPVTPWIFPFLFNDYSSMIVLSVLVIIFSDAPFMNDSTPYECIRAGKKRWIIGQLVYIALTSLIFVVLIIVSGMLCLAPSLEFSGEWGKVINTLAQTNASLQFNIGIPISYSIIQTFSPIVAMGITALLLFLISTFIGYVMYAINLNTNNAVGALAGLILAFLPVLASDGAASWQIYNYIPTSWIDIRLIDITGRSLTPSLAYMIIFLIIAIITLITVVLLTQRKKEIKVMLPV